MTRFKKIGLTGVVLAVGAVSPAVMAQTVELYDLPQYGYHEGGEFTAVTDPNDYNQFYSSKTLVSVNGPGSPVGFETFCIQTQVDFTPYNWGNTTPYNYGVTLSSIGTPDNFALTEGAAYLYWQFATGQLAGYDYDNLNNRLQDAGELQSALWALQGGQSYGGFPTGTGNGITGNVFYNDALSFLGVGNLETPVTLGQSFGVEVLNLTAPGNPNANAQNQLVYLGGGENTHHQNVPDVASTMSLLGIGLSGLAFLRRRA